LSKKSTKKNEGYTTIKENLKKKKKEKKKKRKKKQNKNKKTTKKNHRVNEVNYSRGKETTPKGKR